jgi:hypothetical protein
MFYRYRAIDIAVTVPLAKYAVIVGTKNGELSILLSLSWSQRNGIAGGQHRRFGYCYEL